jgi:KTSC domain
VAEAERPVPLESSVLEAVSYDLESRALTVWFVSGAQYRYAAVPPRVVMQLLSPPDGSHGRAFSRLIRGRYPYERLRGDRDPDAERGPSEPQRP